MNDCKIGLTIFLLREDRITSFREELLEPHAASSIPVSEPLEGTFIPFPSAKDRQPDWVAAVGALLVAPISGDMTSRSPGGLLVGRQHSRDPVQERISCVFQYKWRIPQHSPTNRPQRVNA